MSPFTRNIVLTAAATIVPALIGLAVAPDRARSLPGRIGHGVRGLFEEEDSVEGNLRRVSARLEDLSHQIEAYGGGAVDRLRDTSPAARLAAAIAALVIVPAALAAIFAPDRLRDARDRVTAYRHRDDDADGDWEDDLHDLEESIEDQRDEAYAAVTGSARGGN